MTIPCYDNDFSPWIQYTAHEVTGNHLRGSEAQLDC